MVQARTGSSESFLESCVLKLMFSFALSVDHNGGGCPYGDEIGFLWFGTYVFSPSKTLPQSQSELTFRSFLLHPASGDGNLRTDFLVRQTGVHLQRGFRPAAKPRGGSLFRAGSPPQVSQFPLTGSPLDGQMVAGHQRNLSAPATVTTVGSTVFSSLPHPWKDTH